MLVEPEKVLVEAELAQELGHRGRPRSAGSMVAYARGPYGFLRELDQLDCDLIVASVPKENGLRLAIANRLRRVAGPRTST